MRLATSPDLSRPRRLIVLTLLVGVTVCAILAWRYGLSARPSDTDDATRLYLVRDLLAGRGWYDQRIVRLDPPDGVFLHWSRLIDGGVAGLMALLRQVMAPSAADLAARLIWPLAWLFPALGGALAIARNLGGRSAMFLTVPLLLIDLDLYRQFIPGRIDHHDIQITMAVAALACALAPTRRTTWAAVGGVAAGLGLAIGLEALAMQALVGASYGLALARDRKAAAPAAAYGVALAVASTVFFAAQTPPWRWSLSFCDALALNLLAGLAVAGLGLGLTAVSAARAPAWARLTMLAVTSAAAGGVYLALDPMCIHGPFAAMNPAVRPFWFNRIQEVQSLSAMLRQQRGPAIIAVVTNMLALASAVFLLAREWRAPRTAVILAATAMLGAVIVGYFSWRMQDYVFWFGIPLMGAALSRLAERRLGDLMVPSLIAALALSPAIAGGAVAAVASAMTPAAPRKGPRPFAYQICFDASAYRALAALPPGVVFSHADLGPFMLIYTHDTPIAAPYHRMSEAILAVHDAFSAQPARTEAWVRRRGAAYVVDCPAYPLVATAGGFGDRLRRGETPAWLEQLSKPGAVLTIFRVRPATATSG
jgi:hypothetical protein